MFRLSLLFITVTALELYIFVQITIHFHIGVTVGLILLTGFLGAALARHQGFAVLRAIQESLQRGEVPTRELLDGVCILIAGALLITPGLLTDMTGFALLIPSFRTFLLRSLQHRIEVWVQQQAAVFTARPDFVYMEGAHAPRPNRPPLDTCDSPAKPPDWD